MGVASIVLTLVATVDLREDVRDVMVGTTPASVRDARLNELLHQSTS